MPTSRPTVSVDFYDRDGMPIPMEEWARLVEVEDYRRVAWTAVGDFHVSTVWLGLDAGWSWKYPAPILIFETMAFDRVGDEQFSDRYSTESQARAGHFRAVQWARTTTALRTA